MPPVLDSGNSEGYLEIGDMEGDIEGGELPERPSLLDEDLEVLSLKQKPLRGPRVAGLTSRKCNKLHPLGLLRFLLLL